MPLIKTLKQTNNQPGAFVEQPIRVNAAGKLGVGLAMQPPDNSLWKHPMMCPELPCRKEPRFIPKQSCNSNEKLLFCPKKQLTAPYFPLKHVLARAGKANML